MKSFTSSTTVLIFIFFASYSSYRKFGNAWENLM